MSTELICSTQRLTEFLDQLDKVDLVAIDTETDGIHRFRQVVGISFSLSADEGVYIPIKIWNKDKNALVSPWSNTDKIMAMLEWCLSNKKKKWIGHNIQFDVVAIQNTFGVSILDNVYSDTMLLHHTCISEDPPHELKLLSAKYIDQNALDPQNYLKESVLANGGQWTRDQKEMWKGDYNILGRYAAHDTLYTFKLHNLWYPEIEKQKLQSLWNEEVLPLIKVIHELNTTGIKINVPYFEQLAPQIETNIKELESYIYSELHSEIKEYEFTKAVDKLTITPRSELGKLLVPKGLEFFEKEVLTDKGKMRKEYSPKNISNFKNEVVEFFCRKNEVEHIFSLNSVQDKAHLLFNILGLSSIGKTKTGNDAVDSKTLKIMVEELEKELEDGEEKSTDIIKKMLKRSKEIKILNTYVLPLLENHVDSIVYPQFSQVGTSSGRFSSSEPINFQTLPRDDLRIKAGFIPEDGYVFVNADFSSLEPRCFAHVSDETELKRVYKEGLDLYSHVYITLFKEYQYSAKEEDENFLKKVNPEARKGSKEYTLGFAYKMTEYKLAKILKISVEEAKEIKDLYFSNFRNLKKYQDQCDKSIKYKHYVTNIVGRKRRAKLIPFLQKQYKIDVDNHKEVSNAYERCMKDPAFQSVLETLDRRHKKPKSKRDFAYLVRNEFNNASNFPIQSLAASITNAACIELYDALKREKLDAKLILQVHDEISAISSKKDSQRVAELLQYSMEKNKVAKLISVPMKAAPIITDKSLAEAK